MTSESTALAVLIRSVSLMADRSDLPLVTYSQNREDLYLWALLGHRPNGRYVDVGCNHERLHSVTRLFYDRGWSGINIDANERMAPEYERRTRDRFVACGVGEAAASMTFRDYPHHDGLSTFDGGVMGLHDESRPFVEREVEVRTLASILADHDVEHVDFLKIDVEGLEGAVIRGADFSSVRPTVIVVEASRSDDCEAVLFPLGYRIEFFDGLNTYYLDEAAADVSINNYAGRVLGTGFYTDSEWVRHSRRGAATRRRIILGLGLARRAADKRMRAIRGIDPPFP